MDSAVNHMGIGFDYDIGAAINDHFEGFIYEVKFYNYVKTGT